MVKNGSASIQDILLLFIYLELGAMVEIYFNSNRLPVRFLIYVAITALTRLLLEYLNNLHNIVHSAEEIEKEWAFIEAERAFEEFDLYCRTFNKSGCVRGSDEHKEWCEDIWVPRNQKRKEYPDDICGSYFYPLDIFSWSPSVS